MKRIFLFLAIVATLFPACKDSCTIGKPNNIPPIDWENYNDVPTVFWNYTTEDCSNAGPTGKTIKMYGWINANYLGSVDPNLFPIIDNPEHTYDYWHYSGKISVYINGYSVSSQALLAKLDSFDFTTKCYIKGELFVDDFSTNNCCTTGPQIILRNINDIYFE